MIGLLWLIRLLLCRSSELFLFRSSGVIIWTEMLIMLSFSD